MAKLDSVKNVYACALHVVLELGFRLHRKMS